MSEMASPRIAVLLDQIESDYHLEIIGGVRKVAARSGVHVLVVAGGALGRAPATEVRNFVYDALPQVDVQGFIVLSGCLSNYAGMESLPGFLAPLQNRPIITIGVAVSGVASVLVDNGFGVRKLVSHLVEVHHATQVAFLRGPAGSLESEARFAGYQAALEAHGLPFDARLVVTGGLRREDGTLGVATLLDERGFRPGTLHAVACFNDDVALGAVEELHRRNIGVPQPIAVVGFDDIPTAQVSNPPLSTVKQRPREQGEAAARSLLMAIADRRRVENESVDTQIVIRDSCGCRMRLQNDSRTLDSDRPRLARTCRLALIEKRTAIRAQLSRAAAGRMAGSTDWEGRLIDALAAQIDSEQGGAFLWEFERLARLHQTNGGDPLICHDVLSALRLQALLCSDVQPSLRPQLEDLFQEGRVLLARVAVAMAREHTGAIYARMRQVGRACLAQVGRSDLGALQLVLEEHLPSLGISAFCVSRPTARDPSMSEIVAYKAGGLRLDSARELPASALGLDANLARLGMVVVEPLTYAGQAVGLAAFSWGAAEPSLYEELRDLLGMALYVSRAGIESAPGPLLRAESA